MFRLQASTSDVTEYPLVSAVTQQAHLWWHSHGPFQIKSNQIKIKSNQLYFRQHGP